MHVRGLNKAREQKSKEKETRQVNKSQQLGAGPVKSPLVSLYNEFIRYTDLVTNKAASRCLFKVTAIAL